MTEEEAVKEGYTPNRVLPNGEHAGVIDMQFTTALVVGIDEIGYRTRFCFCTRAEAEQALEEWDGTGFPPGFWVKQKPEDAFNPLSIACPKCGRLSFHPKDVAEKFCSVCGFHEDLTGDKS